MKKNKEFHFWFQELKRLAREKCLLYLIANKDSHRDSFDEGESPEDELHNQIAEANTS